MTQTRPFVRPCAPDPLRRSWARSRSCAHHGMRQQRAGGQTPSHDQEGAARGLAAPTGAPTAHHLGENAAASMAKAATSERSKAITRAPPARPGGRCRRACTEFVLLLKCAVVTVMGKADHDAGIGKHPARGGDHLKTQRGCEALACGFGEPVHEIGLRSADIGRLRVRQHVQVGHVARQRRGQGLERAVARVDATARDVRTAEFWSAWKALIAAAVPLLKVPSKLAR